MFDAGAEVAYRWRGSPHRTMSVSYWPAVTALDEGTVETATALALVHRRIRFPPPVRDSQAGRQPSGRHPARPDPSAKSPHRS
ncbi:hypothetical protein [Streptomyces sp. NPDC006335]|uniref:hypothetical protein n=1 Tax=Streptomyces sp. NPDC006335 TaxID=3156895 RepID=UPI0033ADA3D9